MISMDNLNDIMLKFILEKLPTLIKENDLIKGAIISALSGVVATREDIKELIREMDKRFEEINRRFDALQIQINNNYHELKSEITKLNLTVGSLSDREGKDFEKLILNFLMEQNKIKNIEFKNIIRKEIKDESGKHLTDIDILLENGKTILIEVKFKIHKKDVEHFNIIKHLYEKIYNKPDDMWMLGINASQAAIEEAEKNSIKIIYGRLIGKNKNKKRK